METNGSADFERKKNETFRILYNSLSTVLMYMEDWEQLKTVRGTKTEDLRNIFKVAKEEEDYEVCAVIMKALEERQEKLE